MSEDDHWKSLRDHNAFVAGVNGQPNPYGTFSHHYEQGKHLHRQTNTYASTYVSDEALRIQNEQLKKELKNIGTKIKPIGKPVLKGAILIVAIPVGLAIGLAITLSLVVGIGMTFNLF